MAAYTPVHEIHLLAGTPVNTDDSGYLTPTSAESLDSGPSSSKKLSQRYAYNYRNHASYTPDAMVLYAPRVHSHRAHPSLRHKRKKTSLGRFTLLQRPDSSLSTVDGKKKPPFTDTELSLQTKGEFLLHDNLDHLSLVDNSFDSQENGILDDSAISYDEVDENESVWKSDSKGGNTEQMDTNEKAKDHLEHMSTPYEVCKHDNVNDNKERVNPFDSKKGDLLTEDSDLITDILTNLTRRDISEGPQKICQTFDYTHAIPFSLKYSSQQHLYLFGREKVDFLSLLGETSDHSIIVKAILSYLQPIDLMAVAVVSKTWNRVCKADRDACRRIHCYLEHKQKNKENGAEFLVNKLNSAAAHNHPRIRLRQIQNVGNENSSHIAHNPPSPPPSPSKQRFLQFYKAAQKLENGKMLAPCPRCSLPSQIDVASNVGQCTHERCQYLFCCICHCESHNGNTCPSVSIPRCRKRLGSIGSKASKRNLRRL